MLWDNRNGGGLSALFGGGMLDPEWEASLTEEQRRRLQREAMMASGSELLAASGYSQVPITLGQALGAGMQAGRQAYQGGASAMQQQSLARQKAQEEAQRRQQQEAYLNSLDPQARQLAIAMGVGEYAKQEAQTQGRERAARAKQPSATTLARNLQEAGLQPGTPEYQAEMRRQLNKPTGTTVNVGGAGDPNRLGRLATPEEMDYMRKQGAQIPQGVVLQMTSQGWKPIQGTGPSKAQQQVDAALPQKAAAADNANMILGQLETLLDEGVQTGPIAGSQIGPVPIGRAVDYTRKSMYDAFTKQISPALRQIFRIPGEGALSDADQRLYNLSLPSVEYDEEVNRALIQNLRQMMSNAVQANRELPSQPGDELDDDALVNQYLGG